MRPTAVRTPRHTRFVPPISFARGVPAPECLPVGALAACARAAIERDGARVLSYGPGGGYLPLREWVADRHGVEPDRVVLTNGSLQGFLFLAQLLGRKTRVLVEAPTYDRPLKLLRELGAELTPVPVDEDGLDVDALAEILAAGARPAFLYTIPTFQNPSGCTLSLERRHRLVELARRHGLLVLEDDPYGLVRYEGDPLPTLHALARGEDVVYSSSFSKTIAPGVRVGYLVLPPELAKAVDAVAASTYIAPVVLAQATVFEFLRRGLFDPNLERVTTLLRDRRDAMLDALGTELRGAARWNEPAGGYFLWLELDPDADTADLLARAEANGVTFVPGEDFFVASADGRRAARLAFSSASPSEIREGVRRLAKAVRPTLAAAA